ncbi:MAG: hypothetical protein MUD01_20575 [Chloroflexaceae bacterium]|jgi:hypothetical protein|nr:hypothetical protein [Chloroflexaceae bacterium]
MEVSLAYNQRTACTTTLHESALDFAANLRRPPVRFSGQVKEPVLLRQLMVAMHEVVISDYTDPWRWMWVLDPVITVHPDEIFFECFSGDESVYARLSAPLDAFEPEGLVQYGTTNIDFTWALRSSLQRMRSSRRTTFAVGASGFGVATSGSGGGSHFERKVTLPETWLKGFLQVQSALALRPFTFDVRPADLLTMLAVFQDQKPPRPPHGLRYELRPGEPMRVLVEPWDTPVVFKDSSYEGYERTVRVWGRKRLDLLRGVLPYADRVTVGLFGRGLPHMYSCHCGPFRFTLVLSGWTKNDWATGSAFDQLAPRSPVSAEEMATVYACLVRRLVATRREIASDTGLPAGTVEHALFKLCRAGRVIADVEARRYRLRELFAEPLNLDTIFVPDPRTAVARQLVEDGQIQILQITPPEKNETGRRETRATALVTHNGVTHEALVAIDLDGRLRFGRCTCPAFRNNLMSRGPCEHLQAAHMQLERQLAAEPPVAASSADDEGAGR